MLFVVSQAARLMFIKVLQCLYSSHTALAINYLNTVSEMQRTKTKPFQITVSGTFVVYYSSDGLVTSW